MIDYLAVLVNVYGYVDISFCRRNITAEVLSTNFGELPLNVEIDLSCLKRMNTILFAFT